MYLSKYLSVRKNFPTPMPVFEISKFEKLHDKSINVYYFDTRSKEKAVSPLYISKKRSLSKPINLLLLDDGSKCHYTYITKFSNLFSRKSKNVKFCPYCFQHFSSHSVAIFSCYLKYIIPRKKVA